MDDRTEANRVNICRAIKEILNKVFGRQSISSAAYLSIRIKSIKGRCSLMHKSWYNIKVMTTVPITEKLFIGLQPPSDLHSLLQYMQTEEDESHLCLQFIDTDSVDADASKSVVSINLGLKDSVLKVLHTNRKCVSADLCHMMSEGKNIQQLLMMVKVFAPKCKISFKLKLGEAVSVADMSISSWKNIPGLEVPVVNDTSFLIGADIPSSINEICHPYMYQMSRPICMKVTLDGSTRDLLIHIWCVSQCMSLTSSTEWTSLVTLTVYGPGMIPMDVTPDLALPLLQQVNWKKNRLQLCDISAHNLPEGLFPHHAAVRLRGSFKSGTLPPFILPLYLVLNGHELTEYKCVNANISTILQDQCQNIIHALDNVIDRCLQPVLRLMETQSVLTKSIRSVCKAVVDVVSLSDDNSFRQNVFRSLQVEDTVDLSESLMFHLSTISHRSHQGLWQGGNSSILDKSFDGACSMYGEEPRLQHRSDDCSRPVDTSGGDSFSLITQDRQSRDKPSPDKPVPCNRPGSDSVARNDSSYTTVETYNTQAHVSDHMTESQHFDDDSINASNVSPTNKTKTQQLVQSPFHQLIDADIVQSYEAPDSDQHWMQVHSDRNPGASSTYQSVPNFMFSHTQKDIDTPTKTAVLKQMSPFHQIVDETVHTDLVTECKIESSKTTEPVTEPGVDLDKTPDMRYIIKHMKYVSPFHELTQAEEIIGENKGAEDTDFDFIADPGVQDKDRRFIDNTEFIEDPCAQILNHSFKENNQNNLHIAESEVKAFDCEEVDCFTYGKTDEIKETCFTKNPLKTACTEEDECVKAKQSEMQPGSDDWFDNVLNDVADWY